MRLFKFISASLILCSIYSCQTLKTEQTLYYDSNAISDIDETLFLMQLANPGFIKMRLKEREIATLDNKPVKCFEITYENNQPKKINYLFIDSDTCIKLPFEYNNQQYTEFLIEYNNDKNHKVATLTSSYYGLEKNIRLNEFYSTHKVLYHFNENDLIESINTFYKIGYESSNIILSNRGNKLVVKYFSANDKAIYRNDGVHSLNYTLDENNRILERECFNAEGQPTYRRNKLFFAEKWKYDEFGNKTEKAFFDTEGKPVITNQGYALVKWKYDENGNELERSYFDDGGKSVLNTDGYAVVKAKYDNNLNRIEAATFNDLGEPTNHKYGFALVKWKYDERGNITGRDFFDIDGNPIQIKDGYAGIKWKYDEYGKMTKQTTYNIDGKPSKVDAGYTIVKWKYDNNGRQTEEAYFDDDGDPIQTKYGYAGFNLKYDECGNRTEKGVFDIDGNPTQANIGCTFIKWEYDAYGNITELAYFTNNLKPFLRNDGWHKRKSEYDEKGNKIKYLDYDLENKLTKGTYRNAGKGYKYYRNNFLIEEWEIDENGQVLIHDEGDYKNVAKTYYKRDKQGKLLEKIFLDEEGVEIHATKKNSKSNSGIVLYVPKLEENAMPEAIVATIEIPEKYSGNGYSFKYYSEWDVKSEEILADGTLVFLANKEQPDALIVIGTTTPFSNLNEAMNDAKANFGNMKYTSSVEYTELRQTSFGEYPAIETLFNYNNKNNRHSGIISCINMKKMGVISIATSPDGFFNMTYSASQASLRSFEEL